MILRAHSRCILKKMTVAERGGKKYGSKLALSTFKTSGVVGRFRAIILVLRVVYSTVPGESMRAAMPGICQLITIALWSIDVL